MRVAEGMSQITEENLQFAKQIGVTDIVAANPQVKAADGDYWSYEGLTQLRTRIEAAGLELAALQNFPLSWYVKLRYNLPGREQELENWCRTIENVGRAGIPILHYNWHAVKVWRTSRHTRGRGGAMFTSYDHALMENAPLVGPREIDEEALWENFAYFIKGIMPVAESASVKMALHPDDPPVSPVAGAGALFTRIEAFQRAIDMAPSPSNGLLFCQGCYTEMYGQGVYDAIRHFGRQGKVFYVHFRNVVGQMPNFREAFIDNGDIDMLEAMRVWKEVGFDGPMIPDHLPLIPGDTPDRRAARAHAIGYMKALMQAVGAL
jgi:mannonate dehydratase